MSAQFGITALGFLQSIMVTRALGASGFGIWAIVLATNGLVLSFLAFRTPDALTRFWKDSRISAAPELRGALLASALATEAATRLLAFLIIVGLAPVIAASFLDQPAITAVFVIQGISTLATITRETWFVLLRDERRFRRIATVEFGTHALQVALLTVVWTQGELTLTSLAIIVAGASVCRAGIQVCGILSYIRRYDLAGTVSIRSAWRMRGRLAGFWNLMFVGYLSGSLTTLVKQGDVIVLGYFVDAREVGLYRLAKQLVGLIQMALGNFSSVLYQDFNEQIQRGESVLLRTSIISIARIWTPIALVGIGIGAVFADPVVPLVFGREFQPSVPILHILLGGATLGICVFWLHPLLIATDRARAFLNWVFGLILVTLPAMVFGAAYAGAHGMAIVIAVHWTAAQCAQARLVFPALKRN